MAGGAIDTKNGKCSDVTQKLQESIDEKQRIAQLLIQKDLQLSETNYHLDRQVNQLRVFQDIMNATRIMRVRDEVLHTIAKRLVLDLNFSAAIILLGEESFAVKANYSYKPIEANEELINHPLLWKVYETSSPFFIRKIDHTIPESYQRLIRILHLTSLAILPLQVRTEKYGVLISGVDDPYQILTDEDEEFLEIVGNSISVTLENLAIEERQREIDKMKSEFISIASHQLRTPLSIIKWILKMSLDGDFQGKELIQFLGKAYQSNERMIDLVNDLLDVTRFEEGRMEFHPERMDIVSCVQEIADQFTPLVQKKNQKFITSFPQEEIIIEGDKKLLTQALYNVIDNAIKFTPPNGTISVKLESTSGHEVIFTVSDTGIGIGEEDIPKLFTKFFRAEQAKRMQTEGSGLGLFIVKRIIEEHHGKITVESTVDKGTTLRCYMKKI